MSGDRLASWVAVATLPKKGLLVSEVVATQSGRHRRDELRVISPRQTVRMQLREIWNYRELLGGLVRKELKVKYKDSVLGFLWSLLNPALYLVVYYYMFALVLRAAIPRFAMFLICGLLVWNFFQGSLGAATSAVVNNASIVKKVAFPRSILALASVGASLVHFILQCIVLLGALAIFKQAPDVAYIPVALFALLTLVIFTSAISVFLSAVNVPFRDTQHLVELVLLAWFWATPVCYTFMMIADKLSEKGWSGEWYLINPLVIVVLAMQRTFYVHQDVINVNDKVSKVQVLPHVDIAWYMSRLGILLAVSVVMFFLALKVFDRFQSRFAEEL